MTWTADAAYEGIQTTILGHLGLTRESLEQLREDSRKLAALEAAGVDNWEGYDDAMASLSEEE